VKEPVTGIKRILLIEDEPSIGNACKRALTSEGHDVDIAINGHEALHMIEQKQYDLCLMDIRTPEMNGKETYKQLQKKHPPLASSAIFTTGDVLSEDTARFLKQTGRPFLPKPFSLKELKTMVREILKEE